MMNSGLPVGLRSDTALWQAIATARSRLEEGAALTAVPWPGQPLQLSSLAAPPPEVPIVGGGAAAAAPMLVPSEPAPPVTSVGGAGAAASLPVERALMPISAHPLLVCFLNRDKNQFSSAPADSEESAFAPIAGLDAHRFGWRRFPRSGLSTRPIVRPLAPSLARQCTRQASERAALLAAAPLTAASLALQPDAAVLAA